MGIGLGIWNLNSSGGAASSTGYTYDSLGAAISDETTQITSGTSKLSFRIPYNFQVTGITAYLGTTGSTSTSLTVKSGTTSILNSATTIAANSYFTIDTNINSSYSSLTENAIINIDINSAGTGAKGLKLWINGFRQQAAVGSLNQTVIGGGGASTGVIDGINTFTGGTFANPSVNVTALTINTLTVSGATSLGTVSATTFVSGSTTLNTILNRYAYSSHTHNISDVNNLSGSLNTKANLSGATFTGGVSAITMSAATYYSGSTPLSSIIYNIVTGNTNPTTLVQNGTNTFTGGTAALPTVNITAATLNNLTVTGTASFNTLSATTLYSGSTNLSTIISSIASGLIVSGGTGTTGQFQKIYSSSDTWTAPSGVYSVVVEMWGGGGGGGAGFGTGTNALLGGGGGASGSYILGEVAVTPGTTYTITVGSGGTPGYYVDNIGIPNTYVDAKVGGSSIFNGLIATGGTPGTPGTTASGSTGGIGGVAYYLSGHPSEDLVYTSSYFFTRGNSGSNQAAVGSTSDSSGGAGGDTFLFGRVKVLLDSGGVGGTTPNTSVSQVGGSASYFGGGGAGGTGFYNDGEGNKMGYSGGTGSAGLVILKWNAGSGTTYNFTNTFSGGTISGNTNVTANLSATTFYSGSTSLDTILNRYAYSSHTHSISDVNNLSGSLATKVNLSATTISAQTLSATTFTSGSTDLNTIFNRYAYSSHTHNISDVSNLSGSLSSKASLSGATFSGVTEVAGLKITTFGTGPQIYADADTNTGIMFDGPDIMSLHTGGAQRILINASGQLTNGSQIAGNGWEVYFSGDTRLDSLSAYTLTATTIFSGGTSLETIFGRYALSSHTHAISDVNNLQGSLDTKANLSGATFTSLSGTNIFSGSTNLNSVFAPKTVTMPWEFGFALSDETTQITTGTSKIAFFIPFDATLTGTTISLSTTGSTVTGIDIKKSGTTIYSTKLTINASGKTSLNSSQPAVITGSTIAAWNEFTVDILSAGTSAKGLKLWMTGTRTITY